MFGIDLYELKAKAEKLLDVSADKAAEAIELSKKTGKIILKKTISATETALEQVYDKITLSSLDGRLKENVHKVLDATADVLNSTNNLLDKKEIIMEHKIIMMGGKRAGKSSILSSILSQLRNESPGSICQVEDLTDYTQHIETPEGPKPLPTLDIKQNEIISYIRNRRENTEYLVDMGPTYGKASYVLEVCANSTAVDFEFIDVPGEWMRANFREHKVLVDLVGESDVFVIAIDTPYLMNTDEYINGVYNRVNEISQAMSHIRISDSADLKQIILCPVKCEKWVRNGEYNKVVEKVKCTYRNLINRWVTCPEVTIQIMPIQTIGGVESSRLLPAKLYKAEGKKDRKCPGVSCSEDPLTGLLMGGDGVIIRPTDISTTEDDKKWEIDYMPIPLSWFKLNGDGYNPRFCEQPGFHILKFLVNKEDKISKEKAEEERREREKSGFLRRLYLRIFQPTFGKYLPVWQNVIQKLEEGNYIKTEGDGFCYVREPIK